MKRWCRRRDSLVPRLAASSRRSDRGEPTRACAHPAARDASAPRRRERIKMVPKEGFEPTRACAHCDLNAARLPVPPLRQSRNVPEPGRGKGNSILPAAAKSCQGARDDSRGSTSKWATRKGLPYTFAIASHRLGRARVHPLPDPLTHISAVSPCDLSSWRAECGVRRQPNGRNRPASCNHVEWRDANLLLSSIRDRDVVRARPRR